LVGGTSSTSRAKIASAASARRRVIPRRAQTALALTRARALVIGCRSRSVRPGPPPDHRGSGALVVRHCPVVLRWSRRAHKRSTPVGTQARMPISAPWRQLTARYSRGN
jgi:hypothetical protein